MPPTLDEIRRRGLEVLHHELGRAGFVRFLQQFEAGRGDYTKLRQGWVDQTTLDDLRRLSAPERPRKKTKARKSNSTPGPSE